MLNRDFTKSNREYIKKNKFVLIGTAALLVIGIIIACIFGFNGNFEMKGYNEFSVNVGSVSSKTAREFKADIKSVANSFGAGVDTISILGEGDLTQFVVRYTNCVSEENQTKLNAEIATKLEINISKISDHIEVEPVVKAADYIYTAAAILILVAMATIFSYVRYNGASAIAMLSACALGTFGFMSIGAILRLSIGLSYFAMLVILNVLIAYSAFNIFESIKESSFLENNDYSNAIQTAMKKSNFRLFLLSIAIMIIGVLFVILAPNTARFVSLNIMFMAVVLLAVCSYVIPFIWSMLITHCNRRKVKKEKNKN